MDRFSNSTYDRICLWGGYLMAQNEISMKYWDKSDLYSDLEDEAHHILDREIDEKGIKIHSILSRVKDHDSFMQKIERKEYKNPFDEITDIVGLRVVCLFLSDIKRIEQVIRDNFMLIEEVNKVSENQLEFGYMSYHYVVKLKETYSGYRYDKIKGIPFEIQVRTISMDAWANISHYLDYKTENDVPAELRKDFNAISGLFYVADTHFELFYKESQENKREIESKIGNILENNPSRTDEGINLDSLRIYLAQKFPERLRGTEDSLSSLVNELISNGYKTINGLDIVVNKGMDAALAYEAENKPTSGKFQDVGIIRMLVAIVDEQFRAKYYPHDRHLKYRSLIK
jgi:putative GTP pyrophosphokinase